MGELEVAGWLLGENRTEQSRTVSFSATLTPKKLLGKNIVFVDSSAKALLAKIQKKRNFSLTGKEVGQGIIGGPDKAFIYSDNEVFSADEAAFIHPYHTSAERYAPQKSNELISYLTKDNISSLDDAKHNHFVRHIGRRPESCGNCRSLWLSRS